MPIKQTYLAVFNIPDGSPIILTNYKNEDLKNKLESLLLEKYNMDFKFVKYGLYDLRFRRHRLNKIIRKIIPFCDIHTPELSELLTTGL